MSELRTPDEWHHLLPDVVILDPDGWRGIHAKSWDEPITRDEYLARRGRCTVSGPVYVLPAGMTGEYIGGIRAGWWRCLPDCGNRPHLDGFYAATDDGEWTEPDETWNGRVYRCASCGRYFDQATGAVLGRRDDQTGPPDLPAPARGPEDGDRV